VIVILNKPLNLNLKHFFNPLWLFLLLLPIISSCAKRPSVSIPSACLVGNNPCLQGKVIVEMVTNRGAITFELDGENSPVTAGNFLDLINKGVYDKTIFHRVIKIPSPFVVQGGDPFSKYPVTPEINYGKGSFISPKTGQARFIPLEIKLKTEDVPRYNQLITSPRELSQLQLVHQRGSLAMARSQTLNSGSAQFYIALKSLPELDGRYSVFGRIVGGMDVLDSLKEGDIILQATMIKNK